ncbi:MAG: hypothetical protein ABJV04_04955 [Aliiglaciecola sp.]|uniref:hypothetical protein n=1 Tax=Aliiglaciecola sp. TaxID=1872441 RepID=UPI003298D8E2
MGSHTQFGFLSVLLILMMFFAYLAFKPQPQVFDVIKGGRCPPKVFCHSHCSNHAIAIISDKKVKYRGEVFQAEALIEQIKLADMECGSYSVTILADARIKHGLIVELSDKIKHALPNVVLSWDSSDA